MRNVVLYTLMSLDGSVDEPGQHFGVERQGTPVPGCRLFPPGDEIRRLELISARPTPSGSVLLAYRVPSMPDESTGGRTS